MSRIQNCKSCRNWKEDVPQRHSLSKMGSCWYAVEKTGELHVRESWKCPDWKGRYTRGGKRKNCLNCGSYCDDCFGQGEGYGKCKEWKPNTKRVKKE